MGQSCGCADSTATKLDEIANSSSTTPGIQNAASKKSKSNNSCWAPNLDDDNTSYKSHTES